MPQESEREWNNGRGSSRRSRGKYFKTRLISCHGLSGPTLKLRFANFYVRLNSAAEETVCIIIVFFSSASFSKITRFTSSIQFSSCGLAPSDSEIVIRSNGMTSITTAAAAEELAQTCSFDQGLNIRPTTGASRFNAICSPTRLVPIIVKSPLACTGFRRP